MAHHKTFAFAAYSVAVADLNSDAPAPTNQPQNERTNEPPNRVDQKGIFYYGKRSPSYHVATPFLGCTIAFLVGRDILLPLEAPRHPYSLACMHASMATYISLVREQKMTATEGASAIFPARLSQRSANSTSPTFAEKRHLKLVGHLFKLNFQAACNDK